jgi:transcriptional regulator with XRE-family HTH domain
MATLRAERERGFDTPAFVAALDAQRRSRSMTWRQVADEAGISASTLTRMVQGRRPDVDGLAALLSWSGLSGNDYVRGQQGQADTLAKISTFLRSDPKLSTQAAAALERIIAAAYDEMSLPIPRSSDDRDARGST